LTKVSTTQRSASIWTAHTSELLATDGRSW
jgi:hypothetical protein